VDVEILKCSSCGAPVPLGTEPTAACRHCGTVVTLPEAHRALQRLAGDEEGERREAEGVLARLDGPPSVVVKVLAAVLDLSMFPFLLVYGIPLGIVSILVGLRLAQEIAARAGMPSGDDMPMWLGTTTIIALITSSTFVPRALGVYANRRLTARARLLSALSARPPETPGGASGCRHCGAPLDVPAGGRLARCAYCGTDSAVSLSTPLVAAVRAHVQQLGRHVTDAVATDGVERRAHLRELGKEALRYLGIGTVYAALWAVFAVDDQRARATGGNPELGIGAIFVMALLTIGLVMFSLVRSGAARKEAEDRRAGNDVPGWVRVLGPLGVLALLWLAGRLGACAAL